MPENTPSDPSEMLPDAFKKIFTLFIIVAALSCLATFISGFLVGKLISIGQSNTGIPKKVNDQAKIIISPLPLSSDSQVPQDTTKFLPGKQYYEDTVYLITKDEPRKTIVATATRSEQDTGFNQTTRVSYYDGQKWDRKVDTQTTPDSAIVSNNVIKSWKLNIDPSRVLKQTVEGELKMDNTGISFSTGPLSNEIGMRSLPGYTKFMSQGQGELTINGSGHQAYILYNRIYSLNAAEIQTMIYNVPFDLTTYWLAYWDTHGDFYHIDSTQVDKPTTIYQSHTIGVLENNLGSVAKTFTLKLPDNSPSPSQKINFTLGAPIGSTLICQLLDSEDKAPGSHSTWFMGNVNCDTTVNNTKTTGVGLMEYIRYIQ